MQSYTGDTQRLTPHTDRYDEYTRFLDLLIWRYDQLGQGLDGLWAGFWRALADLLEGGRA